MFDRRTGEVEAHLGGPDAGPRQHSHAAVLDLRLIHELRVREHVGERTLDLVHLAKPEGVEELAADLEELSLFGIGEIGGVAGRGGPRWTRARRRRRCRGGWRGGTASDELARSRRRSLLRR